MRAFQLFRFVSGFTLLASSTAFAPLTPSPSRSSSLLQADSWDSGEAMSGGGTGRVERLEFRIYPDGRVEEKVIGVKGGQCHKVTENINKALGKVVNSEPTEEMFEQEITETLYQVDTSTDDWQSSSSW